MTRGCARCGDCCDPVYLYIDPWTTAARPGSDAEADIAFIREHWTPIDPQEHTWRCDRFDPVHRVCTAHESRPPVCRNYPWYRDGPNAEKGEGLPSGCSYLGDLPPTDRPEGARPLIPVDVVTTKPGAGPRP